MSRRKQSNPKPLKWEENWNESEEGGKSGEKKQEQEEEKEAQDSRPSSQNSDSIDPGSKSPNDFRDENLSPNPINCKKEPTTDTNPTVNPIKEEKVSLDDGNTKMKSSSSSSGSHCYKGKYRKSSIDVENLRDVRSPKYDLKPTRSRHESRSPGPSESSNGIPEPYSHEQLIQAGLPYLHLLPPAIRNDAARFFFMPPNLPSELTAAAVAAMASGSTDPGQLQQKSKKHVVESPVPRTGPVYMCEPCNIKFSSSRTLEAHQTYYCSSRKDTEQDLERKSECGDVDLKSDIRDTPSVTSIGRKRERESSGEEHELSIDESQVLSTEGINKNLVGGGNNQISSPGGNKNLKTGKLYSCSYCSYSADKKVSLNRHMRMHSGGPPSLPNQNGTGNEESGLSTSFSGLNSSGTPGRNSGEGITAADRYCFECEIQFSSLKTFKVHKQYYCSTRHVLKTQLGGVSPGLKAGGSEISVNPTGASPHGSLTPGLKVSGAGSPVTPEGSPIPIGSPIPSQPFVVLPTNPVIIVPYCFIQGASIVPVNLLPSQNAMVVLPNGSVQTLPGTSTPMPLSMSFPSSSHPLGGPLLMSPYGHLDMSPASTTNPTNLSPPGQHSVFNDPKDIIRRICSGSTRISSGSADTVNSLDSQPSQSHSHQSNTSERNSESGVDVEVDRRNGEDSIPAIDLTLRNFIKSNVIEEDEKENHDVSRSGMMVNPILPFSSAQTSSQSQRNEGSSHNDVDFRHELSPSRLSLGSSGSTHSGRRTPRPPSISSSCSTSPAPIIYSSEPKLNGLKLSRVSQGLNSSQPYSSHHGESYPNGSRQIGKTGPKSDYGILGNKLRSGPSPDKINPIATQLPGGAILTTASNQSLAELLMSNPPELTESLAKLNSHLLMNSASPGMQAFDPASVMAAAASLPPDLAMTYLANIQHSIQQQQHQIQAAKQSQQQQAAMKRGVWKCVDCEIVFYKQENFLVHKEQYCASRTTGNNDRGSHVTKETNSSQQRGFKSRENQIPRGESVVSRSSSSAGDVSLSPPLQQQRRIGQGSSTTGDLNPPSLATLKRSSPNSSSPIDTKIQFELENQSRTKSNSPLSLIASPALGSPTRSNTNRIKLEIPLSNSTSQYLCQKCGVKYSSLDNLNTHQTFYCNKRNSGTPSQSLTSESSNNNTSAFSQSKSSHTNSSTIDRLLNHPVERSGFSKCGRCSLAIPEDQMNLHKPVCLGQTDGSGSGTPGAGNIPSATSPTTTTSGWKCPCCDTYSPTMSAAQKHLETHTGIRAFKCVICGYRGNTLRGMRTHIRMHFDKRASDLQEGDYISCITASDLESNGQPQASPTGLTSGTQTTVNGALNKRRNRVTLVG